MASERYVSLTGDDKMIGKQAVEARDKDKQYKNIQKTAEKAGKWLSVGSKATAQSSGYCPQVLMGL
ncbi:hypothetical protein [Photobacterium sp. Hal280]|uniref:hypothetical protein n=1 Tax=Photobacterium sp. Hal280 TaxID=3035163 RepID=UPI00301D8591